MSDFLMEELFLEITNKYDSNLVVYQCGWENCRPKHSYGPAIRDHYLIHFVTKGCGKFYIDDLTFEIKENQGFLICPEDVTYYEADENMPWNYIWVGFNGLKAPEYIRQMGLGKYNPIINTKNSDLVCEYLNKIFESTKLEHGREIRMLGYLYLFLSLIIEESKVNQTVNYKYEYIQKALEYIEMNYSRSISIKNLADHVGLNRSYFSTLFKASLNLSPENFLIQYRINKACELLNQNKTLRISDVSRSVGYMDQLAFSKTFKKVKGCSPSEYLWLKRG
ncbi:AraC family transcriptional regulator [Clostridium hydrogeniformans]|uniref:AraC family transcriptional regulator n=1 Tax=Clostridium hydrogeniformans TaxID=349933 RepID=UPI000554A696|nr:AraC family transcriptional regulator [Clostridium hydrogeniformans]